MNVEFNVMNWMCYEDIIDTQFHWLIIFLNVEQDEVYIPLQQLLLSPLLAPLTYFLQGSTGENADGKGERKKKWLGTTVLHLPGNRKTLALTPSHVHTEHGLLVREWERPQLDHTFKL